MTSVVTRRYGGLKALTVRRKLTLIILLVALVPLGLSAFSGLRIHQEAYDAKVSELRTSAAERGATITDTLLSSTRSSLSALVVDSIQWSGLSPEERLGAQWLVYKQIDDIAVVAILDTHGKGVGTSIFRSEQSDSSLKQHPIIVNADLNRFAESIPFAAARRDGFAVGAISAASASGAPLVPIAFSSPSTSADEPWVVAVYLSLQGPCQALYRGKPLGTSIIMVGADRSVLCSEEAEQLGTQVPAELFGKPGGDPTWSYQEPNGDSYFVARAGTEAGWQVLVREPRAQVVAPGRRILFQMLFWFVVGLVAALAAGMILARGINAPIEVLAAGANALESGDLEHRIPLRGKDEFGLLSASFNTMADKISNWNRDLREQVDEQTRDLKETQDLLVESKKQAALATMGAGIAHEINNPLTGVLSMVQIARSRANKTEGQEKIVKMLEKAEVEARRIRDIVQRMQSLSQESEGIREDVDLEIIVKGALTALGDELVAADVTVANNVGPEAPMVFCVAVELHQALSELLRNATRAMKDADKRTLTLKYELLGKGLVSLDITDTGCGIEEENLGKAFEPFFTAKDNWKSKGLGLSVVQRIITEHQGTIRLRNNEGAGVTIHIVLPTSTKRAHLA